MRAPFRWLGLATVLLFSVSAHADEVLKPYVVFMLDTSGSMVDSGSVTGSGPPSCGGRDNRLNHARCAINRIVNSYGDMVFALGRFRMASSGTVGAGQSCDADGDGSGLEADQCVSNGVGTCTNADHGAEMLTGLVDGGNSAAATWTDFSCGSCGGQGTPLGDQPEIWGAEGNTPLDGTMKSASLYWRGIELATNGNTIWPSASSGFDPIRKDPTNAAFLPVGCDPSPTCTTNCCVSQCRSYISILLTDGVETCNGNAVNPISDLLRTDVTDFESFAECMNATDDDNDGVINDGCPAVSTAETVAQCSDAMDNDGDGTVNDGCAVAGSARRYRIETKVIGFGITPGDPDIERYAQAGGSPDLPGEYEGYYANDEASLQLALSQILADAVKVESCNNLDDDCDGTADEDFLPPALVPGKGGTCNNGQLGQCARTGTLECRADGTGLQCNAVTVTPGVEALPCNGLDDDCDGRIDEQLGCTQCVPTGEICDGNDNDCDGVADQICRCSNDISVRCDGVGNDCGAGTCDCSPITRPCGTGTCQGIETCTAPNTFDGCTAPPSTPELCDGQDNDCDGVCDDFQIECSEQNGACDPNNAASCPATDSLGHPSNSPIPENICRPGVRTCPLDATCDGTNSFDICSNEVLGCGPDAPPGMGCDVCNGLDDDCDNVIDEDFIDADCSTNCGVGRTVCTNGQIMCNSTQATTDATCNNQDDDCDGKFDEDWQCPDVAPADGQCDECGTGTVCMGMPKCTLGQVVCEGGPIGVETCNCLDDNCNNQVDEGTLCPTGSECVNCQCAFRCAEGEFPCPLGKKCEGTGENRFCVNDPCFGVTCGPVNGNLQTCQPKPGFPNEAECVDTCSLINDSNTTDYPPCATGFVCVPGFGECRPDNCTTFPDRCAANESCVAGTCVSNPCAGVTCDAGQYCLGGSCVSSCADVDCPSGQRCRMGACETDPCGQQCPFGQACNDDTGQCIEDPCKFRQCADGQWCNPNSGDCEDDPCVASNVTCPNAGEVCRGGTCIDPETLQPDAANEAYITVGGGGGCSTGGNGSGLGAAFLVLGLVLARKRNRRSLVVGLVGMALAASQMSCSVNDYCINCATGDGGMGGNDDANDGGPTDDGNTTDASCVPAGAEQCNGMDDDCNGLVDDGVLPQVGDPCDNVMGACAGGVKVCDQGTLTCDRLPTPEICDGIDNNCNGTADEGDPGGGGKCGTDVGECVAGTQRCQAFAGCDPSPGCTTNCCIQCDGFIDTRNAAELCNGRDDDCDSMLDENLTNLGPCTWPGATNVGECNIGVLTCEGGAPVCPRAPMTLPPLGAVFPKFEECNGLDDDCDGDEDEIFIKDSDPDNCKDCGTICPTPSKTCINSTNNGASCTTNSDCMGSGNPAPACVVNSQRRCTLGVCGFQCNVGFHDDDGVDTNGCEYRCFATGTEQCDGVDNDCDGTIDENLTPPAGLCRSGGECGTTAPMATCGGMQGWQCNYGGDVQFPETKCDGKNNDCDANIDENQPDVGDDCADDGIGQCRRTGTKECDANNVDGPTVCIYTNNGAMATPETCDNEDEDCDGRVDEGAENGDLPGQEWVDLGNGIEIMKYEASRHDSSSTQQGSTAGVVVANLANSPTGATQAGATATFTTTIAHGLTIGTKVRVAGVAVAGYNGLWTINTVTATTFTATLPTTGLAASGGGNVLRFNGACSKPDSIPWTNVTYPEALAVCESMGASLCSETRWHQACGVVTPTAGAPVAINGGTTATGGTMIEAEDFFANAFAGGPETVCGGSTDDDNDGRVNDGCPAFSSGAGAESGAQCSNATDDDNDGRANDGCPEVIEAGETICTGTSGNDEDGDGRANDGCPEFELGAGPETVCTGTTGNDDDGDGRANDGCPAFEVGAGPETVCGGTSGNDEDGDGRPNDGCPQFGTRAETGAECANTSDDDGDGRDNDGCPAFTLGAGPETGAQCDNNNDDDGDGRDNDGCPATSAGAGPETGAQCDNNSDDDGDGRDNDGCPAVIEGAETACADTVDNDGDGFVNDGCPLFIGGGEAGTQCNNNTDDDGDGVVNDGCPALGPHAWIEDYTQANTNLTQPQQHSGISNMRAMPNGTAIISQANALAQSPRLTYRINIPTTASDWRIWVRMYAVNTNDDVIHLGVTSTPTPAQPTASLTASSVGSWRWMSSAALTLTSGDQYLHLFMGEDGIKVDAIFIARTTTPQPPCQNGASASECASEINGPGGNWSYAANPTTYDAMTCNGADQSAANDSILATGTLTSCYANHTAGGVFDLSGNVKEWTLARVPGQNPIRGGASNDTAAGISCGLNFNLGTDTFFFPNVGFRCCRQ